MRVLPIYFKEFHDIMKDNFKKNYELNIKQMNLFKEKEEDVTDIYRRIYEIRLKNNIDTQNISHNNHGQIPQHKGLPPIHFEKLSCTACHTGEIPQNKS